MRDLKDVSHYYSSRIARFGPTPSGVDWNGAEGQLARFARFNPLFERAPGALSVIDYGCGYGELYSFLTLSFDVKSYVGVDVAPAMLQAARNAFSDDNVVQLSDRLDSVTPAQCVVASGTYNVKLAANLGDWSDYVFDDLKALWGKATFGLSVNFLSGLSDPKKKQPKLLYADPQKILTFLQKEISPLVNLDHSYSPWEFTVTIFREL